MPNTIKSHDNKKKIENKNTKDVRDVNEIFEDEMVFERRAEWYRILRGDTEDDVIQQRRMKAIDQATKIRAAGLEEAQNIWVPMGPNNINGRIKSLAIHPADENILYAGGADGGVWKTTDGGKSWFSTMEKELSMAIGGIAISKSAPNVVYAVTGEDTPGAGPSYPGVGVYKTTDGGNDWELLSRDTNLSISSVAASGDDGNVPSNVLDNDLNTRWSNLGIGSWLRADLGSTQTVSSVDIAWHKGNDRQYFFIIATSTNGFSFFNALYGTSSGTTLNPEKYTFPSKSARYVRITVNGNTDPTEGNLAAITDLDVLSTFFSNRCTRVLVNPFDPNTVYVAGNAGLHKSVDGGTSWANIRTDHVSDVVMDPDSPNIIYAGVWNTGVFKTTDSGSTWTLLSNGLPTGPSADWIKLAMGPPIQIAPTQFLVAKMGVSNVEPYPRAGEMFVTNDAGNSWTYIGTHQGTTIGGMNTWTNLVAVDPLDQDVIFAGSIGLERSNNGGTSFTEIGGTHSDHHALVFSPTDPNVCYMATDGGVYKSTDNGVSWTLSSTGLVCTQLYHLDIAQTSPFAIGSGTQDQGFIKSSGSSDWEDTRGGNEGNYFIIDPNNSNKMYITPWDRLLRRSTDGGSTWTTILNGIGQDVIVRHIAVQPGDSNTLLCAAHPNNVFRSIDQGNNWELVLTTEVISNTKTTYVLFSSYNPAECYAATSDGQLYRSDAYGVFGSWYKPYGPADKPALGWINFMDVSRNLLYIGYGTIGGDPPAKIYKSTDGGIHWIKAAGILPTDSLPNCSVSSIVIDQHNSEVVYATTDIGIFRTRDGGDSWHLFDDGMPRIVTTGLALRRNSNTLYAGSLGRGVYKRVLSERVVLATISNIVAVSAHYAGEIDQHLHAVVGTGDGKIHEIYWKRNQEPGQGVIFQFGPFSEIVDVAAFYGGEIDQNQHVIVGTSDTNDAKVHELYWQGPDPASHSVLWQFPAPLRIVGIAAFYGGEIDQNQHVIVGTSDGKVHELYWQGGQPPTIRVLGQFAANTIVDVAGYYNPADQNQHAIVATKDGNMHELFWQAGGPPGTTILTQFLVDIVGIAAYYNPADQFERLVVGAKSGKVYEEYWQGTDPLSEGVLTEFAANGIVGLDIFHVDNYLPQHLIVATTDGKIHWLTETVVQ